MKLNKIFKISGTIFTVGICSLTTSCNFLDIVPPEQARLEDAVRNPEATLGFLYSTYNGVRNPMQYHLIEMGSTDEFVSSPRWNNNGQKCAYGLYTPESTQDWRWQEFYRSISQIHLFFRELENAVGCSEADIARWKAEANFLLAYYHFELLRFFGPIPVIDHFMEQDTDIADYPGRMHYDYVTNWIVDLLDNEVIDNPYLPDVCEEENVGRANNVAAKALKARVLLTAASPLWNGEFPYPDWKNKIETPGYGNELVSREFSQEKWDKAFAACDAALKAALDADYALYDDSEYYKVQGLADKDLPYIPGFEDQNSPEAIEFKKKVVKMRYVVSAKVNEGNKEIIWGLNKGENFIYAGFPRNILKQQNGNWYHGWSGFTPSLNTIKHFYTDNGLLPSEDTEFFDETEWYQRAGETGASKDVIKLNVKREPRFYAWITFDGGEYGCRFQNKNRFILDCKNSTKQGYNSQEGFRNVNASGYFHQKFLRPNVYKTMQANGFSSNDHDKHQRPLIRIADLYLMLAECYAQKGDAQNVMKNLNPIRKRAGIDELTQTTLDNSSKSLMDWVRDERFIELWGEGHRYFDLRRWCVAEDYLGEGKIKGLNSIIENPTFEQFNQEISVDQPFRWMKRMYLAPIQYNEIIKNPNLVQAPEY